MSTETATQVTEKKSRKHKDKSEKKHSKKRAREDEQIEATPAQASPVKKPRTVEEPSSAPSQTRHLDIAATPSIVPAQDQKSDSESPLYQQTSSFYLPLASIGQSYALEALCAEHLSPLLLTYYPPLRGVVLSYSNARLSEAPPQGAAASASSSLPVLARSVNEYAVSFAWLTAEFVVLRPRKGIWTEGYVNLQNESHLGLVCWNLFSASIDRKRLPEDWTWVEAGSAEAAEEEEEDEASAQHSAGEGHFVDGEGNKVDGLIKFRIRDFETSPSTGEDRGFITIEGSLLPEDKEKELDEQERRKWAERAGQRRGRSRQQIRVR